MIKDTIKIKIDDKVKVIAGKDKGKVGKVLKVNGKKNRLLVENINVVKRHTKPNALRIDRAGSLESEAPIHWSNVMLMCNKCIEPVRVKTKTLDDGKKVRICRKCSEIIDA
jgi:large subunit ribosomal protein L24